MDTASRCRLARPACLQTGLRRGKDRETTLLAQHVGGGWICIHDRGQPHPVLLQLAVDTQMVAAKGPGAEDGYVETLGYCSLPAGRLPLILADYFP